MNILPKSELVLNSDGSVYHLNLKDEQLAETIILVGDPSRVEKISKRFDSIESVVSKREFITHTGYLGLKRLSVVSTGIGPDNIDIVVNELDACKNIDPETRLTKPNKTSLEFIRLGTCGSLQENIEPGQLVFSSKAIGLDNLMHFYQYFQEVSQEYLAEKFRQDVLQNSDLIKPYVCNASESLLTKLIDKEHCGITITSPGFYGPQGREVHLPPRFKNIMMKASAFKYLEEQILNFEMETSAIYGLSSLLGHQALSISTVLAGRMSGQFSLNPTADVENMIETMLERIAHL